MSCNVIVTGGRDFTDRDLVWAVLRKLQPGNIIVGDCPTGVDSFAREWAKSQPRQGYVVYEAFWDKEGRKAGPLRNRRMVQDHKDAVVLAFPGGRGTASCIAEAEAEGLIILQVRQ